MRSSKRPDVIVSFDIEASFSEYKELVWFYKLDSFFSDETI